MKRISIQGKTDSVDTSTVHKVFVGIDVHQRTYSVVSTMNGQVLKKWTTVASPEKLVAQLQTLYPRASMFTAFEAGFSGFVLHRVLENAGIQNLVVNPGSIETAIYNRVKTDKRDALKISSLMEAGRLKGIYISSKCTEYRRLLTRTRAQLMKERTAMKNMIRMRCHQFGLIAPQGYRTMTHQFVTQLLEQSPSAELTMTIRAHWQIWRVLTLKLKPLNLNSKNKLGKILTK